MAKVLLYLIAIVAVLAVTVFVAFKLSPWPSALLIRRIFDRDGEAVARALESHVPPGITAMRDLRYDPDDKDALLDIYFPAAPEQGGAAPATIVPATIVWVHGGGFIAGAKEQVGNYARILAGKGHTVVSIGYSIAPAHIYPTPVRQVNAALGFLTRNAESLHVDPTRLVLAGDSAGAHIVAQVATLASTPGYARTLGITPAFARSQLAGMLLFCGPYDTRRINLDGPYGGAVRTFLWSYSGARDFKADSSFTSASVIEHVTGDFPPSFISVGNADPLASQSYAFADRLSSLGVAVDRLFFPADHAPPLPHEYQFNLDTPAGRLALDRVTVFLATRRPAASPGSPQSARPAARAETPPPRSR